MFELFKYMVIFGNILQMPKHRHIEFNPNCFVLWGTDMGIVMALGFNFQCRVSSTNTRMLIEMPEDQLSRFVALLFRNHKGSYSIREYPGLSTDKNDNSSWSNLIEEVAEAARWDRMRVEQRRLASVMSGRATGAVAAVAAEIASNSPSARATGAVAAEIASNSPSARATGAVAAVADDKIASNMPSARADVADVADDDDAPKLFRDSTFTFDVMEEPVVATDGYTYEQKSIVEWFKTKKTSPTTGAVLTSTNLIPNYSLRSEINQWREYKAKAAAEAKVAAEAKAA
jgi:hypothetical protein